MAKTDQSSSTSNRLLKTLLFILSQEWLTIFFDAYRLLRRWVQQHSHEGMYEIIEYDSTLELNRTGTKAIFKKRQRIKFLQVYINTLSTR